MSGTSFGYCVNSDLACYRDGVNGAPRSLQHQLSVTGGMSVETCTAACKAAGFVLAGLEFGQECCKLSLSSIIPYNGSDKFSGCDSYFPSPVLVPDTDCNLVCTGDNTELCGAGNRLAIYEDTSVPALNLNGCLTCAQLRSGTTSGTSIFNLTAQPVGNSTSLAPVQLAALELAATIEQPTMEEIVVITVSPSLIEKR